MDGEWRAENPSSSTRGYWLSGLYRVMGRKKQFQSYLHEFAHNFLEAKHRGREHLKVWTNTFATETWQETGERVESEDVIKRCEKYPDKHLPEGVLCLTVGADVQKDRIEATVIGWGDGEESWGIHHETILGDPEGLEIWRDFDDFLSRKWKHPSGAMLRIACACVDSGYATRSVYAFTKPRQPRRIYAVKGSNRYDAPLVTKRVVKQGRTTVYFVGGAVAKDSIFARLKLEEVGPRYIHFPHGHGFGDEYFRQLTGEEIRTRMQAGNAIRYYKKIRPNEALDCFVYNMAALEILNPNFERLAANFQKAEPEPEDPDPVPKNLKAQPKPQRRPPGGGFVDAWR